MTSGLDARLRNHPASQAERAAQLIKQHLGFTQFDLAIVFGTGWDHAVETIGAGPEVWAADYPGFTPTTVAGHAGMIRGVRIGNSNVMLFRGRKHRYEFELDNHECIDAVVQNVCVAHAAGCQTVILTNAVGGLRPDLNVGQAVIIRDHNDLITAVPSPLAGPQFLNVNQIYDPELQRHCQRIDPSLKLGVYGAVRGPHFETPAAAEFLRRNGIDIVGMSIIQEAIMAHALGMRILGLSLVTDVIGDNVSHDQVQAVVKSRAPELGEFLRRLIETF